MVRKLFKQCYNCGAKKFTIEQEKDGKIVAVNCLNCAERSEYRSE